jgi:hypothetical protein
MLFFQNSSAAPPTVSLPNTRQVLRSPANVLLLLLALVGEYGFYLSKQLKAYAQLANKLVLMGFSVFNS